MTNEPTYIKELDQDRLAYQLGNVLGFMRDQEWRTLREISGLSGFGEASVSARLRELRSMGHPVNRRRRGEPARGLHEYQVLPKPIDGQGVFL